MVQAHSPAPIHGDRGVAAPIPMPGTPDYTPLITHWLVTSPIYSTTRKQWVIAVVTLADVPGFRPAHLDYATATHELTVTPLDPAGGEQTANSVLRLLLAHELPMVGADQIRVQVQARHGEVLDLVVALAASVVRGHLNPDVTGHAGLTRGAWREVIEGTLADMRAAATQPHPQQQMPPPQPHMLPQHGTRSALVAGTPPGGNHRS